MKILNKNDLNDLPVHDSDFWSAKLIQHQNGETDLIIDIGFYEDEYMELDEALLEFINSNGKASFLLKNCILIDMTMHCIEVQRDVFDFIQIEDLQNGKKRIGISFNSGSKIECTADLIALVK